MSKATGLPPRPLFKKAEPAFNPLSMDETVVPVSTTVSTTGKHVSTRHGKHKDPAAHAAKMKAHMAAKRAKSK